MGRPRKLTRQRVLDAINRWFIECGIPPSVDELRKVLGVGSKQTVLRYLKWLHESGDIERLPGTARGLRSRSTGGRGMETRAVPVVGSVAAGNPILAEENIEGWMRMPKDMARTGARYFLLQVRGNSMNKARVGGDRIEDGDLVLVRQQAIAQDGEIIVALVDDEATVKRLVRKPGYLVLKPDSTESKHRPIVVDQDFRIQGVVTRVLKKGSEVIEESFR